MPKLNADEIVYEPIEVVLNGKTYRVEKVSQDLFTRIKGITVDDESGSDSNVVFEHLGIILNENPEEFKGVDLRTAGRILRFLTLTISEQLEGKND